MLMENGRGATDMPHGGRREPEIETVLITRSTQAMGAGELPNTLSPAAIGHAIFDATVRASVRFLSPRSAC